MRDLKKRTQYRCPSGETYGHSSLWTGDLNAQSERDGYCHGCGAELVEVVNDGHVYRVSWEMQSPFSGEWGPSHRDTDERASAIDQYRQLTEWWRTGAEPVRNVTIARAAQVWEPYDPDQETR